MGVRRLMKKIREFMNGSGWAIVTVLCILFWFFAILAVLSIPLETHAEDYSMTPEEIEEEEYYDSLELLALCVEAEAGNQGLTGKRMVVDVILNRVDHEDWPDTIEEVIADPYEFTSYWDGSIDRVEPTEETFEAVKMELERRTWPKLYYFTANSFGKYGTPWKKVGDHYFSTH